MGHTPALITAQSENLSLEDMLGSLEPLTPILGYAAMFTGIIAVGISLLFVMKRLISPYSSGTWTAPILTFIFGGGSFFIGNMILFSPEDSEDSDDNVIGPPDASPEPSSSPETIESPASAPPAPQPAEPIDWAPYITAGVIAGIVLIAAIAGYFIYRTSSAIKDRKAEEQARQEQRERTERMLASQWHRYEETHHEIEERILQAETDWDTIFQYPALSDPTVETTRAVYEAVRIANHLHTEAPTSLDADQTIASLPYPQAVIQADQTWDAAWVYAKRAGQKHLPAEERKTIKRIQKLLKLAQSPGSESERRLAYQQASKLIDELTVVVVPKPALKLLDRQQRRMIEHQSSNTLDIPLT